RPWPRSRASCRAPPAWRTGPGLWARPCTRRVPRESRLSCGTVRPPPGFPARSQGRDWSMPRGEPARWRPLANPPLASLRLLRESNSRSRNQIWLGEELRRDLRGDARVVDDQVDVEIERAPARELGHPRQQAGSDVLA